MTPYGPSFPPGPAPLDPAIPADARAFSPRHVAIATFLGSPLAGSIVVAIADRRAGFGRVVQHLLIGILFSVVAFAIGTVEPVSGSAMPFVTTLGMQYYAKHSQSLGTKQLVEHGRLYGGGWAALIGLAVFSAYIALYSTLT